MNFNVEPWERPPDAVRGAVRDGLTDVIEIGPVNWHGAQTLVSLHLLRLVSGEMIPFFHPHASGVNFVHFAYGSGPFGVLNDVRALRSCVDGLNKADRFGFARPFIVGDGLAMARADSLAWMHVAKGDGFRSPRYVDSTEFSAPFDALSEPSARVFDWLSRQWQDADSEARFAWAWKDKSAQQRDAYLQQTVPRWGELLELTRFIARVCELPPQFAWVLQSEDSGHPPALRARLAPWSELLLGHFFPIAPLTADAAQCFREFLDKQSGYTRIRGETCTAHQQLEARLHLRAWLQRNAPEELHLVQ